MTETQAAELLTKLGELHQSIDGLEWAAAGLLQICAMIFGALLFFHMVRVLQNGSELF